jgi:transposase
MSESSKVVMSYVGLDVSDRYIQVCILDQEGRLVVEGRRLKTAEAALAQTFGSVERMRIVLEVGPQSPWISRLLQRYGHDVVVVNPYRVRLIADSLKKTDRSDAAVLARLARLDPELVQSVHHRGVEAQLGLGVLNARALLVGQRSALINHIRGVVKAHGYGTLKKSSSAAFAGAVAEDIPQELRPALDLLIAQLANLSEAIRAYDNQIAALVRQHPVARALEAQISGVGPQTVLAFVHSIEDPARFARSRDVGAYFGLVPRQRQSGPSSPELHITKAGNAMVRRLLVQCAHHVISRGPDSDLQRWALARQGTSKAQKRRIVVAVARKLAVLLHHLWRTGVNYEPLYRAEQQGGQGGVMMTAA